MGTKGGGDSIQKEKPDPEESYRLLKRKYLSVRQIKNQKKIKPALEGEKKKGEGRRILTTGRREELKGRGEEGVLAILGERHNKGVPDRPLRGKGKLWGKPS